MTNISEILGKILAIIILILTSIIIIPLVIIDELIIYGKRNRIQYQGS